MRRESEWFAGICWWLDSETEARWRSDPKGKETETRHGEPTSNVHIGGGGQRRSPQNEIFGSPGLSLVVEFQQGVSHTTTPA